VYDSQPYRPHLVVEDPQRRVALTDGVEPASGDYLGVWFTGDGRELRAGIEHRVILELVYYPGVDYSALVPDATFTVREGSRTVGFGRVVEILPNTPVQPDSQRLPLTG